MEREYSYRGIHKLRVLSSQISGIICFIIFTPMAGFLLLIGMTKISVDPDVPLYNDPRITLFCLASWILMISWMGSFNFINFYPTIWLKDDGIELSYFFFFRNHIPWQDVIDVGFENFWGLVLVQARRITPFHRFFSWYHSHSFYPGFLIGKHIENRAILLEEIRKRIR